MANGAMEDGRQWLPPSLQACITYLPTADVKPIFEQLQSQHPKRVQHWQLVPLPSPSECIILLPAVLGIASLTEVLQELRQESDGKEVSDTHKESVLANALKEDVRLEVAPEGAPRAYIQCAEDAVKSCLLASLPSEWKGGRGAKGEKLACELTISKPLGLLGPRDGMTVPLPPNKDEVDPPGALVLGVRFEGELRRKDWAENVMAVGGDSVKGDGTTGALFELYGYFDAEPGSRSSEISLPVPIRCVGSLDAVAWSLEEVLRRRLRSESWCTLETLAWPHGAPNLWPPKGWGADALEVESSDDTVSEKVEELFEKADEFLEQDFGEDKESIAVIRVREGFKEIESGKEKKRLAEEAKAQEEEERQEDLRIKEANRVAAAKALIGQPCTNCGASPVSVLNAAKPTQCTAAPCSLCGGNEARRRKLCWHCGECSPCCRNCFPSEAIRHSEAAVPLIVVGVLEAKPVTESKPDKWNDEPLKETKAGALGLPAVSPSKKSVRTPGAPAVEKSVGWSHVASLNSAAPAPSYPGQRRSSKERTERIENRERERVSKEKESAFRDAVPQTDPDSASLEKLLGAPFRVDLVTGGDGTRCVCFFRKGWERWCPTNTNDDVHDKSTRGNRGDDCPLALFWELQQLLNIPEKLEPYPRLKSWIKTPQSLTLRAAVTARAGDERLVSSRLRTATMAAVSHQLQLKLAATGYGNIDALLGREEDSEVFMGITRSEAPMFKRSDNASIDTAMAILVKRLQTLDAVQELLRMMDNVKDGKSPLHLAALYGLRKVMAVLLKTFCKSKMNASDSSGFTPLMCAVMQGSRGIVRDLIDMGCKINDKDRKGNTVLHHAIAYDRHELMPILINAKAKLQAQDRAGRTPLHCALERNQPETVRILIECGATFHIQNDEGETPLHLSVTYNHFHFVAVMVASGADLNTPDVRGHSALHLAAAQGRNRIVNMLVKGGSNLNSQDAQGRSPLILAAENSRIEVVRTLLDCKANVGMNDVDQNTALHFASDRGEITIARSLLAANHELNVMNKQRQTPLHCAVEKSHVLMAKLLLLRKDCYTNHVDRKRKSPIYIAAEKGHVELVKILLPKCNCTLPGPDGRTPLHIAALNGHANVEELERLKDKERTEFLVQPDEDDEYLVAEMQRSLDGMQVLAGQFRVDTDTEAATDTAVDSPQTGSAPLSPDESRRQSKVSVLDTLDEEAMKTDDSEVVPDQIPQDPDEGMSEEEIEIRKQLEAVQKEEELLRQELESQYNISLNISRCIVTMICEKVNEINPDRLNSKENQGRTPLMFAVLMGHTAVVEVLMRAGADPNVRDDIAGEAKMYANKSALHYACQLGYSDMVKILLNANCDADMQNALGATPLHLAISYYSPTAVLGATLLATPGVLRTPLPGFSAKKKEEQKAEGDEVVDVFSKEALEASEEIDVFARGPCRKADDEDGDLDDQEVGGLENFYPHPMNGCSQEKAHAAGLPNSTVCVFSKRVKQWILCKNCETLLQDSRYGVVYSIVSMLLHEGFADANPLDAESHSPLSRLCALRDEHPQWEYQGLMELLEESNAKHSLHYCAKSAKLNEIRDLLENKADANEKSKEFNFSALHIAAETGNSLIAAALLEAMANVNELDFHGKTPAHYAAQFTNIEVLGLLCDYKCDANVPDHEGVRPIDIAYGRAVLQKLRNVGGERSLWGMVAVGNLEMVKHMLKAKCSLDEQNRLGRDMIHLAVFKKQPEVLYCLLAEKCDANHRDYMGWTPLHYATNIPDVNLVQILLYVKAAPKVKDIKGITAMDLANERHYTQIVEYMSGSKALDWNPSKTFAKR